MYEKTFGLRERPFGVTPDPRVFYKNRLYAEAEANLLYGIRERRGFVLLTGEVGTGKTTVLRRVMQDLAGEIPFVLVFHTNLSFDDVLAFVCRELDIETASPTRLSRIEALNDFLLEQTRQGRTTALFIDEAQNLDDDALEGIRLLSNLETGGEKLLQIVLAGQPELETRLGSPGLRQLTQRIALRCRLERLEPGEVGPYVRERLRHAGASGDDLFHPDAIARLAIYSKGIPRLINMICDNALLIAYASSRRSLDADIITEVADDLRLRELKTPPVDDLVGLETAFHGVERAVAAHPEHPGGRDRAWAVLLVGLFVAAGGLAMWARRDDPWMRVWIGGVAADARALTGSEVISETADPAPTVHDVSVVALEEAPSPSTVDVAETAEAATVSPLRAASGETPPPPADEPHDDATPSAVLFSVPPGSTAYAIAGAAYGSWCQLGLDLMAEANPKIEDLDRIFARQRLRLPSLTRENLLRRASDGTERIVLASYTSAVAANQFATRAVRKTGYDVRVVPKRLSGGVVSYRVEIVGLPAAETARAWRVVADLGLLPPQVAAFTHGRSATGRLLPGRCPDASLIRTAIE